MGLRYRRRINLGGGTGLNVSGSGVSASYRTKYGSIGPNGFSFRTGIPGLSYRGGKGGNAAIVMLAILAITGIFILAWNLLRFVVWLLRELYSSIQRTRVGYSGSLRSSVGASANQVGSNNQANAQLGTPAFKNSTGVAIARNIVFVVVALVAAALLLSPHDQPASTVYPSENAPYKLPKKNLPSVNVAQQPQRIPVPQAVTTNSPRNQENLQSQIINSDPDIQPQNMNASNVEPLTPPPETMPLSLLKPSPTENTNIPTSADVMPSSLDGVVPLEQRAAVRGILAIGFALGEAKEIMSWGNDGSISGNIYQSGDGTDPEGCRQFRVTKLVPTPTSFGYVDVCPGGRIK